MPKAIKLYVKYVDATNRIVGHIAMLLVFAMLFVLFKSSVSKTFFTPSLWTLEMAQFLMVAYYLLGGGYTLQKDHHVRMDLLYGRRSARTRAVMDVITSLFLLFFLGVLLYGGLSSTEYAIKYNEQSYSAWAPYMAPIKVIMCIGIFLTLLQAIAQMFKDIAIARGKPLDREGAEKIAADEAATGGEAR
ncbi:MAG: TRAP transporter small permease subunit [Hyphomicrobiales bacterium]